MSQKKVVNVPQIPSTVYCPVCGEKVKPSELTRGELVALGVTLIDARSRYAKFSCTCGTGGTFAVRVTAEGYVMYSMSFYIYPGRAEKANVVDMKEWLRKSKLNVLP
jgi:hypothetical protein